MTSFLGKGFNLDQFQQMAPEEQEDYKFFVRAMLYAQQLQQQSQQRLWQQLQQQSQQKIPSKRQFGFPLVAKRGRIEIDPETGQELLVKKAPITKKITSSPEMGRWYFQTARTFENLRKQLLGTPAALDPQTREFLSLAPIESLKELGRRAIKPAFTYELGSTARLARDLKRFRTKLQAYIEKYMGIPRQETAGYTLVELVKEIIKEIF